MCLGTVDKEPKVESGNGWKVFNKAPDGTLRSVYMGQKRKYRVGHTYHDRRVGTIVACSGERYPKGYHLFTNQESAELWGSIHANRERQTREVKFSKVVATGEAMHGRHQAVVARKITIL